MLSKNAKYLMGLDYAAIEREKIGTRYCDTSSGRVKRWDGKSWVDVGFFSVRDDGTIIVTEVGSTPDVTITTEMEPC